MSSARQQVQSTAQTVDLSNCDRELIQYSSAVQPHGALVAVLEPEFIVVQVSANTDEMFQIEPDRLLGRDLEELIGAGPGAVLRKRVAREPLTNTPPVHVLRTDVGGQAFHIFAHRIDGLLLLEFELADANAPVTDLFSEVQATVSRLQKTPSVKAFLDLAVSELRELTGYDRVMAYEFLPDGSGKVVAEALEEGLEPYLGLHYPASDIPKPARRLFSITWLRHLPDVSYTPAPLTPQLNPITQTPLDLSYVAGRHVSVMYTKYLENMGVKSTMVITLLKDGRLWGLISCMHHQAPKRIPYEARVACEFLAHMVSSAMAAKEDAENGEARRQAEENLKRLLAILAGRRPTREKQAEANLTLLEAIPCGGAAMVEDGRVNAVGRTPAEHQIRALTAWLSKSEEGLFVTESLQPEYAAAAEYASSASGLAAVRLGQTGGDYILWFRPEMEATVSWAGNPHKPVEITNAGAAIRLTPRGSFAAWREELRGTSAAWDTFEVQAISAFRDMWLAAAADRATELARLNRELEKSNLELDAFAYVASHDLKEPLRGIHNYSALVGRTAKDRLSPEEQDRLQTVLRLTQRMDDLIEGLLHYSRVGRVDLAFDNNDLNHVVAGALELLRPRIEELEATVTVAHLPQVLCDRIRVREVFVNLVQNALKYNDKERKLVEIGCSEGPEPVFFVRDNGIGIEPKHHEEIFGIFRRLHGRDEYGGGSGAGLTIARRAVGRHGGKMWVESIPDQGSTFFFTLAGENV